MATREQLKRKQKFAQVIINKLRKAQELLKEAENELEEFSSVESEEPVKKEIREKWCNFCDFCDGPGLPDGIICSEEHHVEAGIREQHQCYSHHCEYFKDSGKVNAYNLHHYETF